jgi:hypothetical protein
MKNCYEHNLRVNSTLLDGRDSYANEGKDGNGELHFDSVCKNRRLAKVMVLKVDSRVDRKNYGTECRFKEEYERERMPGKSIAHIYASTKSLKGAEELNWTLHLSGRALTQGRRVNLSRCASSAVVGQENTMVEAREKRQATNHFRKTSQPPHVRVVERGTGALLLVGPLVKRQGLSWLVQGVRTPRLILCIELEGCVVFLVIYTYKASTSSSTDRICPQEWLGDHEGKRMRNTPYRHQ